MGDERNSQTRQKSVAPYHYRPVQFFALTYILTWIPWFIAAYFSYRASGTAYQRVFFYIGGLAPSVAAVLLIFSSGNPQLKRDFWNRLVDLRRTRWTYFIVAILLFPALSVASVFISLFFGRSLSQLTIVGNVISWLPLMFIAPVAEEVGWRGYGVDALRSKLGMLNTTLFYGVLWALWHAPLFFINNTYQHDVWKTSPIYVFNFFIGILPVAVIFNWLYYRANRLIPVIILLHFSANVTPETFNIEQYTKLLALPIQFVLAALIIFFDWKTFKEGPQNFLRESATEN